MLRGFAGRILDFQPDSWTTHVAGHPPGALLVFVGLDRIGLGGGGWAATVCVLVGALVAVAVPVTVRRARRRSRRAGGGPVPGAVPRRGVDRRVRRRAVRRRHRDRAGAARDRGDPPQPAARPGRRSGARVRRLPVVRPDADRRTGAGGAGPGATASRRHARRGGGRRWPRWSWRSPWPGSGGSTATTSWSQRYYQGIASHRPYAYWVWANLAAVVVCAGPAAAVILRRAAGTLPIIRRPRTAIPLPLPWCCPSPRCPRSWPPTCPG